MENIRSQLIEKARNIINGDDPSHDIDHALRVLANAECIAQVEGGDLDIIIPAALFHDVIVHPKNSLKSKDSAKDSAKVARDVLEGIKDFDKDKIAKVEEVIIEHSHINGIRPRTPESKIVQDADKLDASGAIAVMRTFSSTGQMKRRFYQPQDPFCEKREPQCSDYALDLFYKRLLKVKDQMNTAKGKELVEKRTLFLYVFLNQLKEELNYDNI